MVYTRAMEAIPLISNNSEVKPKTASGVVKITSAQYRGFAANDPRVHQGCSGSILRAALVELFAGQYFDQETNLHYNHWRYYDPQTGRYITSDRIGLGDGPNTYAYVGNNPLTYIDPNGLSRTKAISQILSGGLGGTGVAAGTGVFNPDDPFGDGVGSGAGSSGGGFGLSPSPIPGAGLICILVPSVCSSLLSDSGTSDTPQQCEKPAIDDVESNDFCEQLALAEAKAGAGTVIISNLGDEPRLIALYGPGPWVKMRHRHICADGRVIVIHYFSNLRGKNVELKFKKR